MMRVGSSSLAGYSSKENVHATSIAGATAGRGRDRVWAVGPGQADRPDPQHRDHRRQGHDLTHLVSGESAEGTFDSTVGRARQPPGQHEQATDHVRLQRQGEVERGRAAEGHRDEDPVHDGKDPSGAVSLGGGSRRAARMHRAALFVYPGPEKESGSPVSIRLPRLPGPILVPGDFAQQGQNTARHDRHRQGRQQAQRHDRSVEAFEKDIVTAFLGRNPSRCTSRASAGLCGSGQGQ